MNHKNVHLNWNHKFENIIQDIYRKIVRCKLEHGKIARSSYNSYHFYTMIIIIITPISGLISCIGASLGAEEHILLITSSVINIITGILMSIIKFNKYDENNNLHMNTAIRYTSLENNIKQQLSLYKKDRITAKKYLIWLNETFDEIFLSSPFLNIEAENTVEDYEMFLEDETEDENELEDALEDEDETEDENVIEDEDDTENGLEDEDDTENGLEDEDKEVSENIIDGLLTYELKRIQNL